MATCPNCKKNLSCGCQKRKASDGTIVCTNCISSYKPKPAAYVSPSPTPLPNLTQEDLNNLQDSLNNNSLFKK